MTQDKASDANATSTPIRVQERHALLVLGMHRSGTSATTRVLNLLGVQLGDKLMGPGYSNDLGFWEHLDAYQINDRLLGELGMSWNDPRRMPEGWETSPQFTQALHEIVRVLMRDFGDVPLWAVKDPRICRLVPLWRAASEQQKVQLNAVLVLRHPDEIAGSLAVRDGLSRGQVHLLWARHLCEAERATRGLNRCVVSYDRLLNDWRSEMKQAAQALAIEWPISYASAGEQIDSFLSRDNRHHVAETSSQALEESVRTWVDMAYQAFGAIGDSQDWTHASRLVDEFERVTQISDDYLDQVRAELDELEVQRGRFDATTALLEQTNQTVAGLIAASEMSTRGELKASFDAGTEMTARLIREVMAALLDEGKQRQQRDSSTLAQLTEEAQRAQERGALLSEQIAELQLQLGDRRNEAQTMQLANARLQEQVSGSKMELERQQDAFSKICEILEARLELASACTWAQAGLIAEREQEIATLSSDLESAKQSLDAANRLANSLDARLVHAMRPWYRKLMPAKSFDVDKEAR